MSIPRTFVPILDSVVGVPPNSTLVLLIGPHRLSGLARKDRRGSHRDIGHHSAPLLLHPVSWLMPFSLRFFHRFPVCVSVTYHAGLLEGNGTVWSFLLSGWLFSGDLPLRVGDVCSMTVNVRTKNIFLSLLPLCDGCVAQSMASNRWSLRRTLKIG